MMYSGKPLPLKAFANGGTPTKDGGAAIGMAGLMKQQRPATSENCDPNHPKLSVFGKEALRNARDSTPVLDESNGSKLQLPQPDGEGGPVAVALSECDNVAAGKSERRPQHAKEVNRLPAAKTSSLTSPAKVSPPISHQHSHGHGGRAPHFCRSPRCASNNPDYATPAQPPPRKYLISKRHLLPGAICTKDPAILASQIEQVSSVTLQAPPSTGKPPKPIRNLENSIRQPSFTNFAPERTTPPLAYETSPTRIPKPPSAHSPAAGPPARLHESIASCSPQESSSGVSRHSAPVTEIYFSELSSPNADAQQPVATKPVSGQPFEDNDISQERIAQSDVGGLLCSSHVRSYKSCTVAAVASTPPRHSFDAGGNSEAVASVSQSQLDSPITSAGDEPVSELSTLPEERQTSPTSMELPEERQTSPTSMELPEERQTSPTSMELPEELPSDQQTPETGGRIVDSASSTEPSSTELEDVTEKLTEKLAFENVEETSRPQVRDCHYREEMSSAFVHNWRTVSEVGSINYHEQENAEEQQFSNSERAHVEGNRVGADCQSEQHAEGNWVGAGCQSEMNVEGTNYHYENNLDGENYGFRNHMPAFDDSPSLKEIEDGQEEVPRGRSIDSYIEELESAQKSKLTEGQREVPKYVRGKGRQLWRSDCRDSREVVFLKQTPQADRRGEDWMVDSILEGAISKLNPSGQGRVRVLVEAFESLMNLGGNPEMAERRASRVWCLNRMEKGEVDEDGEEFEEGDQRVDCYEVSGDGLQLRASMRLSLGGGNRLPLCNQDEVDEIEMSAIEKVQEWDDDCRQSQSFEDLVAESFTSQSQPDGVTQDQESQNEGHFEGSALTLGDSLRKISFSESLTLQNDNDRSSEDFSCDAMTESQFGCHTREDVNQRTDARSTFSLDQDYEHTASRRRRYWKANPVNLEPPGLSSNGGAGKDQRAVRGTPLEPFHLRTEERGMMKEYQFAKQLELMFAEEERLRNPIAQGLPWTTDEPENVPKPPVKGQTRPVEFRHYSDSRAIERAEFDNYMSERAFYMEVQKQEEERLRQLAEQEEVKRLRREMVPRAQLMPFFNQPFIPTRSSKRLTVPKEPTFLNRQHKRAKCIVWQQQQQQRQRPWTYE